MSKGRTVATTIVALACALAANGCGGSPLPPASAAPTTQEVKPVAAAPRAPSAPVALEEYFKIRRIGSRGGVLLSFSHDEQLVAYLSDEAGRADIWVQSVAGGQATQLTRTEGFVHSFSFSPIEDVLIFEADRAGDELPHLYLTDSRGATPRDLTPDLPAGRRTVFLEWANDGKTSCFCRANATRSISTCTSTRSRRARPSGCGKARASFSWRTPATITSASSFRRRCPTQTSTSTWSSAATQRSSRC